MSRRLFNENNSKHTPSILSNCPREIYLPYNLDILFPGSDNSPLQQRPISKKYALSEWVTKQIAAGGIVLPAANTISGVVLTHVDGEPDTLSATVTMTDGTSSTSNVVMTLDDQNASQVSFTPCAPLVSTDVQAAICELLTYLVNYINDVTLVDNTDGTYTFTDAQGNQVIFNAG